MTKSEQFPAVFAQLKDMLQVFTPRLAVETDDPTTYALGVPRTADRPKPASFGMAQIRKGYVSYHLLPAYYFPDLVQHLSPALQRRMQGKSCFNFASIAQLEAVQDELADLTQRGYERFAQTYKA